MFLALEKKLLLNWKYVVGRDETCFGLIMVLSGKEQSYYDFFLTVSNSSDVGFQVEREVTL